MASRPAPKKKTRGTTPAKPRRRRAVAASPEAPKVGRPSSYDPEKHPDLAHNYCLLGATLPEIASFFDVAESTVSKWMVEHPEFSEAIKKGRAVADGTVASRLFQRAAGYQHSAVKILTVSDGNNEGSHVEQVPYTEHYPPDTTAGIFWLKNRRPDLWRDRQQVEHEAGSSLAALVAEAFKRAAP